MSCGKRTSVPLTEKKKYAQMILKGASRSTASDIFNMWLWPREEQPLSPNSRFWRESPGPQAPPESVKKV
jgi:hypothetical protein